MAGTTVDGEGGDGLERRLARLEALVEGLRHEVDELRRQYHTLYRRTGIARDDTGP
jgi:hypothetical protein